MSPETTQSFSIKPFLIYRGTQLLFLILYCLPIFIVPQFNDMYKNFDVELPFITRLIVRYFMFFPIFFFISIMSFSAYKDKKSFKMIFIINLIVCFSILLSALIALYLPMFALGNAV